MGVPCKFTPFGMTPWWKHGTGSLVTMTSSNTPAPFSSSTWQAWSGQDFQGSDNTTLNFGQPVKVVNGQAKLRTAGGSNYTVYVYLTINGVEMLVKTITGISDNSTFYFDIPATYQRREVTSIRIDARSTNGGVYRYVTLAKITEWYKKGV